MKQEFSYYNKIVLHTTTVPMNIRINLNYRVTSLTSPWHTWCSDTSVGSSRHHPGRQLIQSSHMLPSLRRESNRRWSVRADSSYVQYSQDCHCLDQEDATNAMVHLQISLARNRAVTKTNQNFKTESLFDFIPNSKRQGKI